MLQQLKDRYERYAQEAEAVRENAPMLSGFLGFGADPRKDPCHMAFYRDAEQWMKDFLAASPDGEQAYDAVQFILAAPAEHRQQESYWFLYAAQGLCRELIPMLNREQCKALVEMYDREFPRRDRMTAQTAVYKALERGTRGK